MRTVECQKCLGWGYIKEYYGDYDELYDCDECGGAGTVEVDDEDYENALSLEEAQKYARLKAENRILELPVPLGTPIIQCYYEWVSDLDDCFPKQMECCVEPFSYDHLRCWGNGAYLTEEDAREHAKNESYECFYKDWQK